MKQLSICILKAGKISDLSSKLYKYIHSSKLYKYIRNTFNGPHLIACVQVCVEHGWVGANRERESVCVVFTFDMVQTCMYRTGRKIDLTKEHDGGCVLQAR